MADPDAPQRGKEKAGPWLHWIQAAFQGNHPEQGKSLGKSPLSLPSPLTLLSS